MRMILHLDLISFHLGCLVKNILDLIYKFIFHTNTDLTNHSPVFTIIFLVKTI